MGWKGRRSHWDQSEDCARHIMKGYSLRKAHRDPSYDLYTKYVMKLLYTSVCYVLIFQCCKFMKDLRTPLLSTIACIYRIREGDFESPLQIKSLPLTLPPCDAVFFCEHSCIRSGREGRLYPLVSWC